MPPPPQYFHTPTLTHTPTHTNNQPTPQETYIHTQEKIQTHWQTLTNHARHWQTIRNEPHNPNTNPATYLAAHLYWAHKIKENLTAIEKNTIKAHKYYATLLKETPQTTSHLCPLCGQTLLQQHPNQHGYYCPTCDNYTTPTQLQALRQWRINTNSQWLTIKQAAHAYSISPARIYKWIQRGKICRQGKLVNSAQIKQNLL